MVTQIALSKFKNLVKRNNSKGDLARALIACHQALMYYANEANWAVKTIPETPMQQEDQLIVWLADDDPTAVALKVLGRKKTNGRTPRSLAVGATNGGASESAGGTRPNSESTIAESTASDNPIARNNNDEGGKP